MSYEAVSNPYCSSANAQCSNTGIQGWTLTKRDRNGRVVAVESFDGAGQPAPWGTNSTSTGAVTTAYVAETATVTDQAGKQRRRSTDPLGRLVTVVEDPSGTPVTTTYRYSPLGDLTNVNLGGGAAQRPRWFIYDSLRRLTSAINPESGTVSYTYDGNGNMLTRTDARGVVTSYGYDNLNRVISKSYTIPSGAAAATDNVTYSYDGPVAYGWNRLTEVLTASSGTTYTAYDALGRIRSSTQTTGGSSYPFSYTYDLAGGLTGMRYPSGRVVSYSYL